MDMLHDHRHERAAGTGSTASPRFSVEARHNLPVSTQQDPGANRSMEAVFAGRHGERLRRGQTLFLGGDPGNDIFCIQSGVIRFTAILLDGRRMVAGFRVGGEIFSVSARGHYLYSAEAVCDTRFKRMPRAQFALVEAGAGRSRGIWEDEAWFMQAEAIALLHMGSEESLAYFIFEIATRLAGQVKQDACLRLEMSRGDIADYLGLTVETVCRGIRRLRDEGIIEMQGPHEIIVRDPAGLRRRAGANGHG